MVRRFNSNCKSLVTLKVCSYSLLLVAQIALAGCASFRNFVQPPAATDEAAVLAFKPPVPEEWKLENGLTVLFLKDQELPLVRGRIFFRGGSLLVGENEFVALSAMGDQMRQGGAGSRSADQLDLDLERLSGTVSSGFSQEFGSVGFSGLSTEFDNLFDIFAEVVLEPRFESDRLNLWKGQSIEGIRRRIEDPNTVSSIGFTQLLYGGTPYGRVSLDSNVLSVSRPQLLKLHREFVNPKGAILAVAGNVTRAQVEAAVNKWFGSWKPETTELPSFPSINQASKPGIYFVELPLAQATVQIGHLGLPRLTPDYPAIDLFNQIFGSSGFGSRLVKQVRTEKGLSYVVYGGISPGVVKGSNSIVLQTKAESVGDAVNTSIEVLEDMQKNPVMMSELEDARLAVKNSFIFNFDSVEATIGRLARQRLLNYPTDFDDTYSDKIDEVRPDDVLHVAKGRWNPSDFIVLVVGNAAALKSVEEATQRTSGPLAGLSISKLRFDKSLVVN